MNFNEITGFSKDDMFKNVTNIKKMLRLCGEFKKLSDEGNEEALEVFTALQELARRIFEEQGNQSAYIVRNYQMNIDNDITSTLLEMTKPEINKTLTATLTPYIVVVKKKKAPKKK